MDSAGVLQLLGSDSRNEAVLRMLDECGLHKYRPALKRDDPDALTDWFPVSDLGIEFGFKDEAYLRGLDPSLRRKGGLVFYEVILYGEHPEMRRFRGTLPFGLSFADSRHEARAKLARLDRPRRSHVRDVWEMPFFRLVVSYAPDDSRITDVIAYVPDAPWPPNGDDAEALPSMAAIIALFGASPTDPAFVETFRPLGVMYEIDAADLTGVVDMRREFGFELSFERVSSDPSRGRRPRSALKSITVYRERDLESRGWRGDLPFGIRMDDAPPQVLAKVPGEPVRQSEHTLTGSALWHLDRCTLHVIYSTLDNLVYRVTVSRPVARH